MIESPELHGDVTPARLSEHLEAAAREFSDRHLAGVLDEIVAKARARGEGCLGREATERALGEQRVRTLLVSSGLQRSEPDLADRLVTGALIDNGALVHMVPRDVGERLDREGEGVGALLHYRLEDAPPETD